MDIVVVAFGLIAGGITLGLFTVTRAPMGYEDEAGFHFGVQGPSGTSAS
jgi:hypothetical protein